MSKCLRCGADESWLEGRVSPEPVDREKVYKLQEALSSLAASLENYLDHPGCNNPARATAMAKLRWAMDEARKKL